MERCPLCGELKTEAKIEPTVQKTAPKPSHRADPMDELNDIIEGLTEEPRHKSAAPKRMVENKTPAPRSTSPVFQTNCG